MRRLLLPLLLLLAAPALAQNEPEWRLAVEQDVLLHPFRYEPRTIRLRAGEPVALLFVNDSRANLAFSAPAFFRAVRMRPRDRDIIEHGGFRLAPGERRSVELVAPAGTYAARSTYFLHRLLGMRAQIIVE